MLPKAHLEEEPSLYSLFGKRTPQAEGALSARVPCYLFDCLIQDKRHTGNPEGCLHLASFQRQSLLATNWESLNVWAI